MFRVQSSGSDMNLLHNAIMKYSKRGSAWSMEGDGCKLPVAYRKPLLKSSRHIQGTPRVKVTTSGECSYVKIYRYNPKHLWPKLNGYGDNGQRKVLTSCISAYCTYSAVSALTLTEQCSRPLCECTSSAQRDKIVLHYCQIFMRYIQCLVTLRTTMTWVRVFL